MISWESNPAYQPTIFELEALISSDPPPCIFINDPTSPRLTAQVVQSVVSRAGSVKWAHVNAVQTFTSRLLYDSILNALADWTPIWSDGCANWGTSTDGQRWNENMDAFIHGLQALSLGADRPLPNGKGKQKESNDQPIVIIIEQADRLKDTLPDLVVPFTRLADLSGLNLCVIFISAAPWEDLRPPLGAAPDPYYITILPPTKKDLISGLSSNFASMATVGDNSYDPALLPLYTHFLTTVYDIVWSFIKDPQELAYIAAARWPGFVKPAVDDYERRVRERAQNMIQDGDEDDAIELLPSEDTRIRLMRLYKPTFMAAMESLYPRLTDATHWEAQNPTDENLFLKDGGYKLPSAIFTAETPGTGMAALPRMSKFILVTAFIASTNPAKSDLRMFGRGLDEKKRKRKARKTMSNKTAKVAQRLLGPTPFPLDRFLAILGAILEEYDADDRVSNPQFTIPGEYTDMEISRVAVYSAITELVAIKLLHRTSPADRIDGPPTFKCGISLDVARSLARELGVPLSDLLWDPV